MRAVTVSTLLIGSCLVAAAFLSFSEDKGRSAPVSFDVPRQLALAPARVKYSSLRIVSWNIDRGTQLPTIAGELQQQAPQLCLLQEVDWGTKRTNGGDIAADLARSLRLNMAYGIEFEELSQEADRRPAYIGQATLTSLPIRKTRILRFGGQSGFWRPHAWIPSSVPLMQRRVGGRIALVTELEFQGRPLVVYNLHLESRSAGRIQKEQLDEVFQDMRRYKPDAAVIIGGDLNSKYFASSYLRKLEAEGFQSVLGEKVERTHTIAMALDWIFVRGPFRVEHGQVCRDWKGSDHYPVIAEVAATSKQ